MAACIVGAQLVMVPVAVVVGRNADRWGHKPIFLAGFAVLVLRGLLYTLSDGPAWLLFVQLLDGVGAGIFGALFPVVIAAITRGSGRFNAAQGAVATVQGLGAAFSTTLAGTLIVWGGYDLAFMVLAAIAGLGLILYWWRMPETARRA
jgi:MFS family permease